MPPKKPLKIDRRQYGSSLSSNYVKFRRGQFVVVLLAVAAIGAGSVAIGFALGWSL